MRRLTVLGLVLLLVRAQLCASRRFLPQNEASAFLQRHRRANSLFEESKKGNLERECIEELCNKEEAREIFENNLETEYFYPKYVVCLGSHRVGINNPSSENPGIPQNLRTCVQEISNQCLPLPCYKEGYERCVDGRGKYTCVCKPGWRGQHCEEDINECEDPEFPAGCSQSCYNLPGSFTCRCERGFYTHDNIHCIDINECVLYPSVCVEPSTCVNIPGSFECRCPLGYRYNTSSHECVDVDECEQDKCGGECVNSVGSFSCLCDGRKGLKLAEDGRLCEPIPQCLDLYDHKHEEMLYLGEQFSGVPVIYLRFRLPTETRFAAEFDFRTFDPEGVILYAESSPDSWIMLGLRSGRIEVQFKNQHTVKMTSGGKAINDGQWHVISVEELMGSVSVKISKEAVMSINSPQRLFSPVNDKLETKVYIAGLPNRNQSLIKPASVQQRPYSQSCATTHTHHSYSQSCVTTHTSQLQSELCNYTHTHTSQLQSELCNHTHITVTVRAVQLHTHTSQLQSELCNYTHITVTVRAVLLHTHTSQLQSELCYYTHTHISYSRSVTAHTHTHITVTVRAVLLHTHTHTHISYSQSCVTTHTNTHTSTLQSELCNYTHTSQLQSELCNYTHTHHSYSQSCVITRTHTPVTVEV
ncbi:vitamin K-dependent protein S isoform X2 [Pseudorasbora parva]|uniref:vitamin K-dependent protein S isoform X2 n=1 Tax=Pseudorasbora parva TaxID=51549 RepID=UPI00351F7F6E